MHIISATELTLKGFCLSVMRELLSFHQVIPSVPEDIEQIHILLPYWAPDVNNKYIIITLTTVVL